MNQVLARGCYRSSKGREFRNQDLVAVTEYKGGCIGAIHNPRETFWIGDGPTRELNGSNRDGPGSELEERSQQMDPLRK